MESELDYTADDGDDLTSANDLKEDKPKDKKDKSKGKGGKKRKVKKKKLKKIKLPKEMVMNDQGEIVTAKEYVLDKTYVLNNQARNNDQIPACVSKKTGTIVGSFNLRATANETLQENLVEQEKDAV